LIGGSRIAFAQRAIVYDEKTAKSDQLVSQRSRWISTWFKYAWLGRSILSKGIRNRNINQILFGIIVVRPPLFLFILASLICLLISLLFNPIHAMCWIAGVGLF